jgi:hypothetical protein
MMKKKYLKRRTENGGGASGMVRFSSSYEATMAMPGDDY